MAHVSFIIFVHSITRWNANYGVSFTFWIRAFRASDKNAKCHTFFMSLDQILSQIERGRVQFHFYAVIDIVGDALGMAIVKKLLALGIKPDERFDFVHGIVSKRDEPKAGGTPLTSMSYYVGEKSKWTGMPTYKVDGTGYGLAIYAPRHGLKGSR